MVPLHLNLAASQLELNDYKMALKNCNRVLELDPNNDKAKYRSAKAYWKQGLGQQAHEMLLLIKTQDRTSDVRSFADEVEKHLKKEAGKEREIYQKMFAEKGGGE